MSLFRLRFGRHLGSILASIWELQGLILDAPGSMIDFKMLIFGPLGSSPQHFPLQALPFLDDDDDQQDDDDDHEHDDDA